MNDDKLGAWIEKTVMVDNPSAPKLTSRHAHKASRPQQTHPRPHSKGPFKKASIRHSRVHPRPHSKTSSEKAAPRHLSARPLPHSKQTFQHNAYHGKLRIIPLGGLEEVGKNMMVLEYVKPGHNIPSDIIIIDAGFQFPEEDMLGIDYVIPDISYLRGKADKIRGIIFTHGHLDHIGGIPYFYEELGCPPLFGTKLTLGIAKKRMEEFNLEKKAQFHSTDFNAVLPLGAFQVELFRVNHSFPDSAGVIIHTPAGTIVHTGDFKFDFTPADKKPADFAKIAGLSGRNVVALFSDSTNALIPGYTMSERQVGETMDGIIKNISGRIIVALFSSSIGRVQQIIDAAFQHGRKVYMSGKSLVDNVGIATQLGYIKRDSGTIKNIKHASKREIEADDALILTTGSQGESLSALARMAMRDHAYIQLKKDDTVVFSSSPIIGNERAIMAVVNNLCQMGVRAISSRAMDVHTSGHGQQEDLKLMINLVKPKYVVPIHGELYMRVEHANLAEGIGYKKDHVVVVNNGMVIEVLNGNLCVLDETVETNYIMVDGLGVGNIGSKILMERQIMAGNGVLLVLFYSRGAGEKLSSPPDVISRGFIYLKESQELIQAVSEEAKKAYNDIIVRDKKAARKDVKKYISSRLDRFIHKKIEKTPLILPVIIDK